MCHSKGFTLWCTQEGSSESLDFKATFGLKNLVRVQGMVTPISRCTYGYDWGYNSYSGYTMGVAYHTTAYTTSHVVMVDSRSQRSPAV